MATTAKRIGGIVGIGLLLGGIGAAALYYKIEKDTEGMGVEPPPPKLTPARHAALVPQMKANRFPGLDGQCRGKGLFDFGFVVEGGTYTENVSIGLEMGCEPFGGTQHNITNFFCCSGETPLDRLLPLDHR